jgi:hypothetical protein
MNLNPFRHTNKHSLSVTPCFSTCAICIPNVGSALLVAQVILNYETGRILI